MKVSASRLRRAGFHEGNFAPTGGAYVDMYSTRMSAPELRLCREDGKCNVFWSTRALETLGLHAPVPLEVKAHDGSTLYATLQLPEGTTAAAASR